MDVRRAQAQRTGPTVTAIRGRADMACRDVRGAGMSHPQRGRRRDGGCLLSWRGSTLSVVGLGRTSGSLRGVRVDPRHLSAAVADGHVFDLARRRSARQPRQCGPGELGQEGRCWRMIYENPVGQPGHCMQPVEWVGRWKVLKAGRRCGRASGTRTSCPGLGQLASPPRPAIWRVICG